jgi:hypothetical protein
MLAIVGAGHAREQKTIAGRFDRLRTGTPRSYTAFRFLTQQSCHPHPKVLPTTSCTSLDKPLAAATFCNAARTGQSKSMTHQPSCAGHCRSGPCPRSFFCSRAWPAPTNKPAGRARVGRNNQRALRRMCFIRCNALCLLHPTIYHPHPKALPTTSCTSFDKPLAAATFCNAACICFFSAGRYFFQ